MLDEAASSNVMSAELLTVERRFADSLIRGDSDTLGDLLADDWVFIGPNGKLTVRSMFLDTVRRGEFSQLTMKIDEPRVRVYGDVGIVTTRVRTSGTYRGHSHAVDERSTDVFVWADNRWKCVLTQLTGLSEE